MAQKDLVSWLGDAYLEEYKKQYEAQVGVPGDISPLVKMEREFVQRFVCFAIEKLKGTPPISVYMAMQGIGLKLVDGTEVPVLPQEDLTQPTNTWMPITNPVRNPATDGISDTRSIPITGGGR